MLGVALGISREVRAGRTIKPESAVHFLSPNDSPNALSVQIPPTLTSLSRVQARVGDSVEANGSGFNRDTIVSYSGFALPGAFRVPLPTSFINSNTVRFIVQLTNVSVAGDTLYIWVENPGVASLGPLPLLVLPPPPPPLSGWVDLHTHPMINLAFGGKLVHGGPDGSVDNQGVANGSLLPTDRFCQNRVRARSIEEGLSDDSPSHGGWNLLNLRCGDNFRKFFIHNFQTANNALVTGNNGYARGFPDFSEWPRWNDITHQKMWFEWIRRARDGGLRVMVALATNNKTLGDAVSGDLPTDDKASADLQLAEIKSFVSRHDDFMETAFNAADLNRIVRANKIAVVLGVEIDDIGNFNRSPLVTLSEDAAQVLISDEIQRLYTSGVRYIFPVHVIDNNFGGTAIYENGFNTSNLREWGHFWDIECANVEDNITHTYREQTDILRDLAGLKLGLDPFRHAGPGPVCPPSVQPNPRKSSGHRNARGLTGLGRIAIKEMMKRGMIIDIDHMSQKTADATIDIAEQFGYPLVSGHSSIRGMAGANAENSRTPVQLQRLSKLHGMFGLGSDGVRAPAWYQQYDQAIKIMGSSYRNGAVAFGTDLNGLVKGPQPGGRLSGSSIGVVRYDATFPQSSTGTKTWDYNTEGVAHYGMLPDFILHVRSVSGDSNDRVNNHLFRSADYFWHTWEQLEARRTNLLAGGMMILSDANSGLAMNAYGGAVHGTYLKLVNNCSSVNPDCTWTYRDGMILSDTNPRLAVNAFGGARHGTELRLVNNCTKENTDCTWTYRKGMFVSDSNPNLAINAYGGAVNGTSLRLVNNCTEGNADCTWTQLNAMLLSDTNATLAMNVYGGARHGAVLALVNNCAPDNSDCTWTFRKGMLLSAANPNLAMNAYGGAQHGTELKLVNNCQSNNSDCTWTIHKGMLLSDRNASLAMNAYGGARHGTVLRLVSNCPANNSDCKWTRGQH